MHVGWPSDLTYYKLLTDWGSLIGGLFALFAGALAYKSGSVQASATRQAAADQIAAGTRRDRLQARGIVLGIFPELMEMETAHERVRRFFSPNGTSPTAAGSAQGFADAMRIQVPPLMARNVDNFFLIDPGGEALVQIVSVTDQYNRLLDTIAANGNVSDYNHLQGHLQAIELALKEALREVRQLHG